ncbi:Glycerophosphoryl diester phosphodiesterase family-domain-containing protein [Glomus cerebriforme]|uniref:Glycerophosphoryl diester phosphodiesterase family-domain-containing protein n=1 Tax=Glomus cerebriforme TaxID=658196 RepID=A0A397TMZ8_9GLOM|nr:Glycerophosphoryl diester phosphodiesterase family-domain-containing protein [Glomus cerebriforme]
MKFGKILKNQIPPEWSRNYISYKALKKLINNAVKTGRTAVGDDIVIDRELEKVDNFFLYKHAEIDRRLRILSEKYRPNFDSYADEEFLPVMMQTKELIHKLLHFADINKKGFTKILKKFDKRLGREDKDFYLETKVNILPFTTNSSLTEMLDSIEHWIQEVQRRMAEFKQNIHQNIEFTTKVRLRRINLTEEQDRMLTNSICNDDTDILKDLINQITLDLSKSSNLNIQISPIKKTLTSMLYKACHFRAMRCIKLLLKSGASIVDDDDINERSLIHKLMIHGGRLPKDKSSPLTTPSSSPTNSVIGPEGLQITQITYSTETFLTQKDSKNDDGRTNNICEDTSLISLILENVPETEYSKVLLKDVFGRRPLHYAAINGFEKSTKILLEFLIKTDQFPSQQGFSDPSWFDNDGLTPLLCAVLRGHTTVVNCIIKVGSIKNVDAISNVADSSPLMGSVNFTSTTISPATNQHITTAAYVSPYSVSHTHAQTPLAIACRFGHSTTAKLLLAYGADPDIQDEEGESPLHLAARNGSGDCVRLLVGLDDNEHRNVPDNIKNILKSNFKKANMEVKENFYGWTPLFLAAMEGHTECVKVLIQAGADPNVMDNSGWTPHIHAVFRGHSAVKKILRPVTAFEEPSPLFSTPMNAEINSKSSKKLNSTSAELTYGHKYLQDQSLILVTLGNTDLRKSINPVELYNSQISSSIIPSTSVSLVVSAKNANGEPAIIDLPINNTSAVDPIMFYSSDVDNVILTFDIIPTYGTKKQFIGRATALLSSVKTSSGPQHSSLMGSVTVPILDTNLEVIGRVVFEFLIVKPFRHKNLAVGGRHTYWTTIKVIGHRGFGMNRVGTLNLQIGENTLISFITAASLGAEYVEFDVQLTKDHVPVIYHDWTITETGYDIPIHAITHKQFLKLKGQRFGVEELLARDQNIRKEFQSPSNQNGIKEQSDNREKKRVKRSYSVPINTFMRSENKERKLKGNDDGIIQAPFATLEETFKQVPLNIGFNVEVKYPMIDEAEADGLPAYHTELNLFVDAILQCVYEHAQQNRNIIFSSFNPDICLMLAFKQPNYPVFFLTDCGEETMADIRCNSIQEAIKFAKFAGLLGIVTTSAPVIEAPKLVKTIKETGLLLFTYGAMNNDVTNVRLQKKAGVDAVIVDSVLAVRKGLQND